MKKIFAVLFVVALIFTVSCAEKSSETVPENDMNDTGKLTGYECIIVQHTQVDNSALSQMSEGNPLGYPANTTLADDVAKRIADIEEKYECTVTLKYESTSTSTIAATALIGDYYGEAIFSGSHDVTHTLMKNLILYPLEEIDEIKITDVDMWGGANVIEVHAQNGHAYAVCPMNWLYKQPRSISIFVINNMLEKQYGVTNPREYIENGNWTWESLETTLREHTVVDGENTVYGLACRFFDFIKLAVLGNGCRGTYKNSDGQIVFDYTSDKALEGFQWVKDVVLEYGDCFEYGTKGECDWPHTTSSFIAGKSMMDLTSPSVLYTQLIYEVDEFSVIPFPTGPSGTYGEWPSVLESADSFSIFYNAKEPEACATVLYALCQPLDSYGSRDGMIDYLASNVVFDELDAEVLVNAHKNGKYSYWWGRDTDSFWRAFQDGAILTKSITEIFQKKSHMLDVIVEDLMAPNCGIEDWFE